MLKAVDTPTLANVRFSRIKQREPEVDGFTRLHVVAILRHKVTRLCYPYAVEYEAISTWSIPAVTFQPTRTAPNWW